MTKKQIESQIENYLIKRCKEENIFCAKFVSPGLNGVPDRILVMPSYTLFVELKRPQGVTRALQDAIIRKMRKSGAIIYRCDTKKKVDEILEKLKNNQLPDYFKDYKITMSTKEKENIIKDFINLLKNYKYFDNIKIFYDDKILYSKTNKRLKKHPIFNLKYEDNIDLYDYLEYGNPNTVTFSFDNSKLYQDFNDNKKIKKDIKDLFKNNGLTIVQGYSHSFSLDKN